MDVCIDNPRLWAAANGYQLHQLDNRAFAVHSGDTGIGALVHTEGGYVFRTEQAQPKPVTDNDEHLLSLNSQAHYTSQSFGLSDLLPFSGETLKKGSDEIVLDANVSGTGVAERVSECNYWLPYAAEHYHISRDIRDYVLVPIPAIFSNLPNTNGESLSQKEMLRFDPEHGQQMYKTFRGKGTFLEHANKDITKAKGVILDAFLRPVPFNNKYWKIVLLLAYDRTKDPVLAQNILNKTTNAYSVGFLYSSYCCSICGVRVGRGINLHPCEHTQLGRPTHKLPDGRLAYRMCENGLGFECSSVKTPAFVSAIGPTVYDVRNL